MSKPKGLRPSTQQWLVDLFTAGFIVLCIPVPIIIALTQ
jgi:hypothetical protein